VTSKHRPWRCLRLKMDLTCGFHMSVVEGGLGQGEGRARWEFRVKVHAWQHMWYALACHVGKKGIFE
jgi:hypothetical protein